MPLGRPPLWPKPWLDLAALCGGSVALRQELGYSSRTTLPDKINGRSPWCKADYLLLVGLCKRHGVSMIPLLSGRACSALADGKKFIEVCKG